MDRQMEIEEILANIEDMLDCYFKACSVKVTAMDLAKIALVFANGIRSALGQAGIEVRTPPRG